MIVRTRELKESALDWAVAKARGVNVHIALGNVYPNLIRNVDHKHGGNQNYNPSTLWEHGGPIVEKHIHTLIKRNGQWQAEAMDDSIFPFCLSLKGETALIAAMRTYVAANFGPDIDIPGELL